jgi:hypothetical protein
MTITPEYSGAVRIVPAECERGGPGQQQYVLDEYQGDLDRCTGNRRGEGATEQQAGNASQIRKFDRQLLPDRPQDGQHDAQADADVGRRGVPRPGRNEEGKQTHCEPHHRREHVAPRHHRCAVDARVSRCDYGRHGRTSPASNSR